MKDTLLVPVVYLLSLVLVTVVCTVIFFLFLSVSSYNPVSGIPWKDIIISLPAQAGRFLPAVISFSVLAVSIRIHRQRGPRFLPQAFLAVFSFAVLFWTAGILPTGPVPGTNGRPDSPVIIPHQISIFDGAIVYTNGQNGRILQDVYIKDYRNPEGHFTRYSTAYIDQRRIVDKEGTTLAEFSTSNPVFFRLFAPPEIAAGFFNDIGIVSHRFALAVSEGGLFRTLVFAAFILFCIAVQTAGRITRWPLINVSLALAFYRGFFYLYRITLDEDLLDFLSNSLPDAGLDLLPEFLLLAITAVLFLITLFKSGKRKPGKEAVQ